MIIPSKEEMAEAAGVWWLKQRVKALEEALEYALCIIDHELPPEPDPRGDDGEAQSQFYRAENLRKARALLLPGEVER